jgi:iron complex outermembrane recepter protein
MFKLNPVSKILKYSLITSIAATSLTPALAMAAEEDEAKKDIEKIAVVGSRAAPRSIGDSPVPVDVISAEELNKQGATDMVSMLQATVPSFNVNEQPINDASTLVRPANLRGMASDHALVLVNGVRRHRSAVITFLGGGLSDGAQGPDLSIIPAIALKQVEVLRDGAAAQYGSDAIAGVINFVLKDDKEGGQFEAKYGSYYEGDGDTLQLAGNIGVPLSENGFANFSFEARDAEATSRSVQRDDAAALIGAGNSNVANPAQIWGNPDVKNDIKLFGNFGIDLDDNSEAYLFMNYAEREVEGGFYFRNPHTRGGVYDGGDGTLLVGDMTDDMSGNCPTDILVGDNVLQNPRYINEVLNNPNCFAFNEMFPGGFTPKFGGTIVDSSIAIGTKGESSRFIEELNYDVSFYAGSNEVDFMIKNTINPSLGSKSPNSFKPGKYIQSEQALNIDFSKFYDDFNSGSLNVAVGLEFRHESYESIAGDYKSWEIGPLASQGFGIGSNGFPGLSAKSAGKADRDSYAMYADLEYEVTDDLLVSGALRFEDFSDFGDTTKGKLAAHYRLNDEFSVRGAYGTGFKAPTIGQTNVRNVTTAFGTDGKLIDRATLPPTDPISVRKGGTQLTPEESESLSFGVVADLDSGLFVTVDFFNIEVTDRIATVSGIKLTQEDIDFLVANGVQDASSFTEVSYFTNDFDTETTGIDVVASYSQDFMDGENKYSLAYNWTETEVTSASDNISAERIRMIEENLPSQRWSFTTTHQNEGWSLMARVNYFGDIYEDHLDSGLPIEDISAEYTLDLEGRYEVNASFDFVLGAKNALDNTPDENTDWDNEIAGAKYPVTSPIGINGGFYYVKGVYKF